MKGTIKRKKIRSRQGENICIIYKTLKTHNKKTNNKQFFIR